MTDDYGDDREYGRPDRKKKQHEPLAAPVDPVIKRTDFFEWLEGIFFGEQEHPERITINSVSGRELERLGPLIKQFIYRPEAGKDGKPSKEKIVALSNEIVTRCQTECNAVGRRMIYGVHVYHAVRNGDEPYERFIIRCEPKGKTANNGVPGDLGRAGFGADDDGEISMQERYAVHALHRDERMFQLFAAAMEGVMDRMDRHIERQEKSQENLRERYERQQEISERALSLEEERAAKREWRQLGIKLADRGGTMGMDLILPALMTKITGKTLPGIAESAESRLLKDFFRSQADGGKLTEAESATVFGIFDEGPHGEHVCQREGILSYAQGRLMWEISQCQAPAERIDEFLSGPLVITEDQRTRLLQVLGVDRLAPIMARLAARMSPPEHTK